MVGAGIWIECAGSCVEWKEMTDTCGFVRLKQGKTERNSKIVVLKGYLIQVIHVST